MVGDPDFINTGVLNTSPVPIYLQSVTDPLLRNLIAEDTTPVLPVTNVSASINGVLVTLTKGLALPAGQELQVNVTRIVQASDVPNPFPPGGFAMGSTTTYVFNATQAGAINNTGTTISAPTTWTVGIFKPSITIGLKVDKTSAFVGNTLTYTVTVSNTSSTNSPNLVANFQTGTLSNVLVSGVLRGVVTGLDTSHMFVGEFVFGPGLRANSKILAVNSALGKVTLNKSVLGAAVGTSPQLFYGFGPAIVNGVTQHFVPPPSNFVFPAALMDREGIFPGEVIQFTYTHVVTSSDPIPLKNTLDMFFFVADSELHPLAWPDRIHGLSNGVTTLPPWSLKMWF
jgi:uncharacterized repeat protein (TIGR01451 family)